MSCCIDLTGATVTTDGCTMVIKDSDGNIIKMMNLVTMDVRVTGDTTYYLDGVTGWQVDNATALSLGIDADTLLPLIQVCKVGVEPVEVEYTDGSVQVVCDFNDDSIKFLIQVTYDELTKTYVFTKTDGTVVVEGVDFKVCDHAADKTYIECRSWIDDVNGDQTNLVSYVEPICISVKNGVIESESLGLFTDKYYNTPYTVLGTATDPNLIGTAATWNSLRLEISSGQSWSPAMDIRSYTIRVKGISDGSTFTDSFGNTTTLDDNEVSTWGFDHSTAQSAPVVTPLGSAIILITATTHV